MKGSPYYDMARDLGYKGDEALQMARALEADHRKLMELEDRQDRERSNTENDCSQFSVSPSSEERSNGT